MFPHSLHPLNFAPPAHRGGAASAGSGDVTLSAHLRRATQAAHAALEAAPGMQALMSPTLTLDGYRRWVTTWARAWLPLEATVLSRLPPEYPSELIPAKRGHWLQADLRALGLSEASCTVPLGVPAVSGARWLGAAYVLRGSQLGATVVAAHLDRYLQLSGAGALFFQAHSMDGASVASSFRGWCDALDTLELDLAQRALAVETAQQFFQFLQRHFEETA